MAILNRTKIIDVTPTISTSIYAANDVIGGLMTLSVNNAGGSGTVRHVEIIDSDDEKAGLKLYFFDDNPGTIADNAAFAPSDANLGKLIGVVTVAAGDYTSVNSNAYADKRDVNIDFEPADSGVIYCYAVATATPTYTATSDLKFRFVCYLDASA